MPIAFRHHRLPNGLTLVAEVDAAAHSAAVGFYVKTGARDEATKVMGVSHFLEHMMFKGTSDLSAEELNQAFDRIGARNNAFTSNEVTCFYAHALPEHAPATLDLIARMMRPALRQADFDTEKGVILEEIAMYKDQPFWVLYENCVEKHFGSHPLSHRVLGTTESIQALARDEMQHYFDARYSGDNTVVSLAGKVDFDRAIEQVEALCGNWPATRPRRDNSAPVIVGGTLDLKDEKVNRAYLLGLCDAPAQNDDRRYAAGLLAQLLGTPDNSLFHWALIESGIAEEAQASYSGHDGFGEYFVFASGDPARADEIWSIARAQMDTILSKVGELDLERLRNKMATAVTLGAERPQDRMHRLGQMWTSRAEYRPLDEDLARINNVTIDDIRAVHEAFPLVPRTFGRLLPATDA
jgi:predicted Zn-dependent peptidase